MIWRRGGLRLFCFDIPPSVSLFAFCFVNCNVTCICICQMCMMMMCVLKGEWGSVLLGDVTDVISGTSVVAR